MTRFLRAAVLPALLLATAGPALGQDAAFRAARLPAPVLVALDPPGGKSHAPTMDAAGRLRIGDVRALPKAASVESWQPVAGGFVARLRAASAEARGLRVQLALAAVPGAMEVRVQGDDGRVEAMALDPFLGPEAWTPWTAGATQMIEVFSPVAPAPGAVQVAAVAHFTGSPFEKAAASCTLSTACTSGDPDLDALIAERKKSSARIQFLSGGGAFLCSATLVDTPNRPAPYVLTANHCIEDVASANSVTAFWFYEASACGAGGANPGFVQTAGGMQMVFTNFNTDSTLLLMNGTPPGGTVRAPINAARLAADQDVVSISHPRGDTSRWATGRMAGEGRDSDRPYDMYVVNFERGIIEGGSSGSGLYTIAGGRLELRGVLSQGAVDLSCTQPNLFALYTRTDVIHAQIAPYIGVTAFAADDAPNRVSEPSSPVSIAALDARGSAVSLARRIDYPGDIDLFRFSISQPSWASGFTTGGQDTVGTFLDANGVALESNDDAERGHTNTGLTRRLQPGTYYYHVAHWQPGLTGPYEVTLRADRVDANYTALWWNASESGWGINVNHQGNILFATLFTYDRDGTPMWLVMSGGTRRADGAYEGELFRTTGPAFNAVLWTAIGFAPVGTMRLAFSGADAGTLTYTYDGATVTKAITRQLFREPPECTWSAFDRSWESNVQDLWWNPNESGWGINLTHQEDVVFATLFTYAADGRGLWLVMPEGNRTASGTFSGTLYRTRGPAFDAAPWSAITSEAVGTMTLSFTHGNAGTLSYTVDGVAVTKAIQRQVFSMPRTRCES